MVKSLRQLLPALVLLPLAICQGGSARKGIRWVVCYSDKARAEEFLAFDLAVLDSDNHPPLALLSRPAKAVLAYLSLGEVGNHRAYFEAVKAEGILLDENPNWPGSFSVDVRDPRWPQRVIGQLVPAILASGLQRCVSRYAGRSRRIGKGRSRAIPGHERGCGASGEGAA